MLEGSKAADDPPGLALSVGGRYSAAPLRAIGLGFSSRTSAELGLPIWPRG